MEFYSLKHRRMVAIPVDDVRKRVITRETKNGAQERYMLEAKSIVEGAAVSLHKFVSKATFDAFPEQAS